MFIITREYVIFFEGLIIASKVPVLYSLLETELHVTERVHDTPFQELSLSRDFKSKTEQRN